MSIQYCALADSQVHFCHGHENPPAVWQMPLSLAKKSREGLLADRVNFLILGFLKMDVQTKLPFWKPRKKDKAPPETEPPAPSGQEPVASGEGDTCGVPAAVPAAPGAQALYPDQTSHMQVIRIRSGEPHPPASWETLAMTMLAPS